jgi:hypothetical protein
MVVIFVKQDDGLVMLNAENLNRQDFSGEKCVFETLCALLHFQKKVINFILKQAF